MTRFLVFADVHLSDGPPEQREDTYYNDILAKLVELRGVAERIGATATLIAGDLFHRKTPRDVSHRLVAEYGAVLRDFGDVLAIPGNHDYRANLEALARSPYGVLREWGAITDLHTSGVRWFSSGTGMVGVTGAAYRPNEPREMYLPPPLDGVGALHVHLCHGMLLPVTSSKPFEFTNVAEVEDTSASVTLCGHYHPGWKAQWRKGKLFYMCGAVARLAAHESDMNRGPGFAVLSVIHEDCRWKVRITEAPLKSARDAKAVFAVEVLQAKKTREAELARFEQELAAGTFELATVDIRSAARELAASSKVDAAVLDEVLSLLEEAER